MAPSVKRSEVAWFFEQHGIDHAERVEFTLYGFTVWSFRRDDKGQYMLAPGRRDPIMDVKYYPYAEEKVAHGH